MEVNKGEVEQILKTLPIGYYIGRKVDVRLSDESCSYYDIMNDAITISYPQLQSALQNTTSAILENDIRCLLYHETSHAFLTPRTLNAVDFINIFEDERIESALRYYYKNVNFRSFVKRLNNFNNEKPTNSLSFFYQIVRYRIGPKFLLEKLHRLLMEYINLNRYSNENATYYYGCAVRRFYDLCNKTYEALQYGNKSKYESVKNAASDESSYLTTSDSEFRQELIKAGFAEPDKDDENETESQTIEDDDDETNIDVNGNASAEQDDKDNDDNDEQTQTNNNVVYDEDYENEVDEETSNKLMTQAVGQFDSDDVQSSIDQILASYKSVMRNNGSAINAYSGKFEPRSVIRNDYKYFVQQNRLGHIKAYSKMHLNLFIDCSGSFHNNDIAVNKLLKALTRFEKQSADFTFDLISCSDGQVVRQKNDRIQSSDGGTFLTENINQTFRKQQFTDANNFNIVLYDGDMFCSRYFHDFDKNTPKRIKIFDTKNTVCILDYSNAGYAKHLTNCKVILTDNYVDNLLSNVLIALKQFSKI